MNNEFQRIYLLVLVIKLTILASMPSKERWMTSKMEGNLIALASMAFFPFPFLLSFLDGDCACKPGCYEVLFDFKLTGAPIWRQKINITNNHTSRYSVDYLTS